MASSDDGTKEVSNMETALGDFSGLNGMELIIDGWFHERGVMWPGQSMSLKVRMKPKEMLSSMLRGRGFWMYGLRRPYNFAAAFSQIIAPY